MKKHLFKEIKAKYRTPRDISGNYSMGGKMIFSNLSIPIIAWLLPTKVTGNQVTVFWIFLGIVSCLLFCFGNYWISLLAAILFFIHAVLDYVDGAIARARGSVSMEGVYLDRMGHDIIYPASFFCIAVGTTRIYPTGWILTIGFLASLGYLIYHWARRAKILTAIMLPHPYFFKWESAVIGKNHVLSKVSFLRRMYRKVRYLWDPQNYRLLMLIAAIAGKLNWLIFFYGISYPIVAVAALIHQSRCGYDWVFESLAQMQSGKSTGLSSMEHEG